MLKLQRQSNCQKKFFFSFIFLKNVSLLFMLASLSDNLVVKLCNTRIAVKHLHLPVVLYSLSLSHSLYLFKSSVCINEYLFHLLQNFLLLLEARHNVLLLKETPTFSKYDTLKNVLHFMHTVYEYLRIRLCNKE